MWHILSYTNLSLSLSLSLANSILTHTPKLTIYERVVNESQIYMKYINKTLFTRSCNIFDSNHLHIAGYRHIKNCR